MLKRKRANVLPAAARPGTSIVSVLTPAVQRPVGRDLLVGVVPVAVGVPVDPGVQGPLPWRRSPEWSADSPGIRSVTKTTPSSSSVSTTSSPVAVALGWPSASPSTLRPR